MAYMISSDPNLDSFRFTSTGWPGWRSTELEMQRSCQRQITSVGQRGDDQSSGVTEVLEPIWKLRIHCSDVQELLSPVISACTKDNGINQDHHVERQAPLN